MDIFDVLASPNATALDILRCNQRGISDADIIKGRRKLANYEAKCAKLAKGDMENADEALQKAAVGTLADAVTPYTSTTNANSDLAPMVPKQIDTVLKDLVANESDLVLTGLVPRTPAESATYETVTQTAITNRPLASQFLSELATDLANRATVNASRRDLVRIRIEGQVAAVTELAQGVSLVTQTGLVSRGALDFEEKRASRLLMLNREVNLLTANSAVDSNAYDGFLTRIAGLSNSAGAWTTTTGRNVSDLAGGVLTGATLRNTCNYLRKSRQSITSRIKTVLVSPDVYFNLQEEAQANVRYDGSGNKIGVDKKAALIFYPDTSRLVIKTTYGEVEVVTMPLLTGLYQRNPNSSAVGTSPGSLSLSVSIGSGTGFFETADAGVYTWRVTGFGPLGETAPATVSGTIAAGQVATISTGDAAFQASLTGYRVERTGPGGAVATSEFMGDWPLNTSGSGSSTAIVDNNLLRPGRNHVYFLTNDPSHYQWASLVSLYRKPLAQTGMNYPFMVLDLGSLIVNAPECLAVTLNAQAAAS